MHMIFISPTFFKNKIKNVNDNTVCPGKLLCVFFVNVTYFFSAYTK